MLLNLETTPDIKVWGTFKDYSGLLNKRLQYLYELLQDFKSKRLAMINKDRNFFQYKKQRFSVFNFTPYKQLQTSSRKVAVKYVGPLVIYKIEE